MKSASSILLLSLAVTGWAVAETPKKAPITKYTHLWSDSPFTSKPVVEGGPPPVNLLDDYALLGVSPIGAGYRVTIMNKKKPEDRITVDTDHPREGFSIIKVVRKAGDPLATVVSMASGTFTGTVAFDEKLLTLAAPPAAAKPNPQAQPGVPGQPPQVQPGQPPQRQPRPRVVPPPTPGGQPQPQAQPQVQPNQGQTQGQPNSNNNRRPDRRGGR